MFEQASQISFSLSITGASHDLQALEPRGGDALSQPLAFEWQRGSGYPSPEEREEPHGQPATPSQANPADAQNPGAPLMQRLREDVPLAERGQTAKGGTVLPCPLSEGPCRQARATGADA